METHGAATVGQAVELFDQGKYWEAFEAFAEVYHQCQDSSEKQKVFQILEEAYYLPNKEELKHTYDSNVALLKKYPYFWNKSFHRFEELGFQLFPVSDEHYYCYSREEHKFQGVYDAKTRRQMRYFFENLDQPLRVTDEDNLYNLTFLNDNVRRSEDFADDNHIYLLYTSFEPLERLMLTCDLEAVLRQEKFVFLIGEKNWKRYPLNFKKKYGVNYRRLNTAPLRIEEINRIYFNQYYSYSGTDFFEGVLNGTDYALVLNGWFFYESPREIVDTVLDYTRNPDRSVNVQTFLDLTRKYVKDVKFSGWQYMVQVLPDILKDREEAKVHELWKAVFIAAMMASERFEGKHYFSRISPVIFFDPHGGPCSDFYELLKYFKYPAVEATIREPITRLMRFASVFGFETVFDTGVQATDITFIAASTYRHSEDIPKWLADSGFYVAKLEDLKLKPEQTLRSVCRVMNIPYTEKLLDGRVGMWGVLFTNEKGERLIGFDQRSVKRDISDMVSGDDMERLNIYYQTIHKYFRYPCSEESRKLSEEEAKKLFSRPFHFEMVYAARRKAYMDRMASAPPEEREVLRNLLNTRYRMTPEEARGKIWASMTETYMKGFYKGLALPEVMFPEEDGAPQPLSQAQRLQRGGI